jgi:peptidoglycan/LPS O-acetylase OafA/YrhL
MVVARKVLAHHPKAAKAGLVAALLGAMIAAVPPERRPHMIRIMGVVAAVIVGLVVVLIGVVLMIGATMTPASPSQPLPTWNPVPAVMMVPPTHDVSAPYWYHGAPG